MGIYYTNQTLEAFHLLNQQGFLTGTERFVWEEFRSPYKWMIKQMNKRLNTNSSFPIWLWTKKPNLDDEGHFAKGTKAVSLTVEVSDNDILLSDFDAWHAVLGDWYCALTDEEDDLFEAGKASITKEESWERIFDLKAIHGSKLWTIPEHTIQGVTPVIGKGQIVAIEYFVAK